MINQANELASVIDDIESFCHGGKEDGKKRVMEADYQRNKKYEQKQIRDDDKRLKDLDTCEVLVRSILAFGMDHSNNLKVKDLRVLLHYHFGSEKLKGSQRKWNLWGMLNVLESIGTVLCRYGGGWGVCCNK